MCHAELANPPAPPLSSLTHAQTSSLMVLSPLSPFPTPESRSDVPPQDRWCWQHSKAGDTIPKPKGTKCGCLIIDTGSFGSEAPLTSTFVIETAFQF